MLNILQREWLPTRLALEVWPPLEQKPASAPPHLCGACEAPSTALMPGGRILKRDTCLLGFAFLQQKALELYPGAKRVAVGDITSMFWVGRFV